MSRRSRDPVPPGLSWFVGMALLLLLLVLLLGNLGGWWR